MFNEFPREVANPNRRLVYSKEEFYNFVNKFIKFTNLYTSVYHFRVVDRERNKPFYDSAVVDKIFIDVDEPSELPNLLNIHQWLCKKELLHTIIFSGKGFHLYIILKELDEGLSGWIKKEAIRRWVLDNIQNLKFDEVVLGDLARITRIPNTFNFRRGRFCIPLTSEHLEKSYEEICEIARKQNFKYEFFGKKKVSLNVKEVKSTWENLEKNFKFEERGQVILTPIDFPPFIKKIIEKKKKFWDKSMGWKERYIIILWLKENGYTFKECVEYLKTILTKEEFIHCVYDEKQPQYIYSKEFTKNPYHFPTIPCLLRYGFQLTEEDFKFFEENRLYLRMEDLRDLFG
ncbi:MAG: hypothetical protein QXG39_00340 [Candidatus Aenigmatarchaeota archaeon]